MGLFHQTLKNAESELNKHAPDFKKANKILVKHFMAHGSEMSNGILHRLETNCKKYLINLEEAYTFAHEQNKNKSLEHIKLCRSHLNLIKIDIKKLRDTERISLE
jgi:hypothetical protein